MFILRPSGPQTQHPLAPLLLGDDIRITLLEKSRPLGLSPFVSLLTITGEPVLVLKLDLNQLGPEVSLVAMVTVTSSYSHSTFYDIMRYLKNSQGIWKATHGNPCFPRPPNNPWVEKQCILLLEPGNFVPLKPCLWDTSPFHFKYCTFCYFCSIFTGGLVTRLGISLKKKITPGYKEFKWKQMNESLMGLIFCN